jgi:hypothetical protein
MQTVEKYDIFELRLQGGTTPVAEFDCSGNSRCVKGFRTGDGEFAIRFMPDTTGVWQYSVKTGEAEKTGAFTCVTTTGCNHGPVVAEGGHFRYADGKSYVPVGTTCYAWIHQTPELIAQTLETLSNVPFNKIRMCVFPKHMPYNNNAPLFYHFEKKRSRC